jgi:hypothetical protein
MTIRHDFASRPEKPARVSAWIAAASETFCSGCDGGQHYIYGFDGCDVRPDLSELLPFPYLLA